MGENRNGAPENIPVIRHFVTPPFCYVVSGAAEKEPSDKKKAIKKNHHRTASSSLLHCNAAMEKHATVAGLDLNIQCPASHTVAPVLSLYLRSQGQSTCRAADLLTKATGSSPHPARYSRFTFPVLAPPGGGCSSAVGRANHRGEWRALPQCLI
jgi:hypothetical protein